jgi:hypothetical protein
MDDGLDISSSYALTDTAYPSSSTLYMIVDTFRIGHVLEHDIADL